MADDRTERWLKAGREGLEMIEQEFIDSVLDAIRSGVVEPERAVDPLTGRRPPREVLGGSRSSLRVHAFARCCEILGALCPQDRDVVVRRLRAFYATPEPRGEDDADAQGS